MASIKVLPVTQEDVGLVHPLDGPLSAAGSLWALDTFTVRHLDDRRVRRFEAGADDPRLSKTAKAAKPGPDAAGPSGPQAPPAADAKE